MDVTVAVLSKSKVHENESDTASAWHEAHRAVPDDATLAPLTAVQDCFAIIIFNRCNDF